MKIATESNPVTIVGGGASSNFSINMNAKAFRILSDGLYKDKIGSIVRELTCNGLDAHVMAGKDDVPVVIHFPDQFEPWFTVKDEGVGMSPETVETVYTTYFESTKNSNNDEIGGLGLGGKSPLGYTDQYNVTSIWNGVKRAYSIFIGENGMPQIQLMAELDTDEHNGIEVKMAVKSSDFTRFETAIREQLQFFKVKPTIINYKNGSDFAWPVKNSVFFESVNCEIFKNAGYHAKVNLVQGPVGYPLDFNTVVSHLDANQTSLLRMMQNVGANLFFKIGEIGVIASREGVEYNSHTIASVKAKLDVVKAELEAFVKAELDKCDTVYAKVFFINGMQNFRAVVSGLDIDLSPAKSQGNGTYAFEIGNGKGFTKIEKATNKFSGQEYNETIRLITVNRYVNVGVSGFSIARSAIDIHAIVPNIGKVAVAIVDAKYNFVAKMRHYFKSNNLQNLIVLKACNDDAKMDAKFIKELSESLGGFEDIIRVSDMPEVPKNTYKTTRDYSRPTCYTVDLDGKTDWDSVSDWDTCYDKLADIVKENEYDTVLYVTVANRRIAHNSNNWTLNTLVKAGMIDLPVYAIRESDEAKLAATGAKWITVNDYVTDMVAKIKSDHKVKRYIVVSSINGALEKAIGQKLLGLEGLNPRSDIARMIRLYKRCATYKSNNPVNTSIQAISQVDPNDHIANKIVNSRVVDLFNKTPMLSYVRYNGAYGQLDVKEAEHIVQYINHFTG